MAAPEITVIADAVVAALNGQTFDAPYNTALGAVRKYVPVYHLKELGVLAVPVVPNGETAEVAARSKLRAVDYKIDVGILKRVPQIVQADVDALMRLAEQLMDFLIVTDLTGLPTPAGKAVALAVANEPIYDPHHLDELQQFTSVVTVTYRSYR